MCSPTRLRTEQPRSRYLLMAYQITWNVTSTEFPLSSGHVYKAAGFYNIQLHKTCFGRIAGLDCKPTTPRLTAHFAGNDTHRNTRSEAGESGMLCYVLIVALTDSLARGKEACENKITLFNPPYWDRICLSSSDFSF